MKNTSCERCNSEFFTAYNNSNTTCPFCGYSFFITGESMIRSHKRSEIRRSCTLGGNGTNLTVQARDISEGGVGIEAELGAAIIKGDNLKVVIKDFDINTAARVRWTIKENNTLRAGLQFLQ